LFDKNKDGKISTDDLAAALKSIGRESTPAEVQELINSIDTDGNGTVDQSEFLTMMARKSSLDTEDVYTQAFKIFDKDGDGLITPEDLANVLAAFGEPISAAEAEAVVGEADVDGDNKINYEEFIKIITTPAHPHHH
ncbi:calmodulin-like 3, partial [Cladochytrium tenue]